MSQKLLKKNISFAQQNRVSTSTWFIFSSLLFFLRFFLRGFSIETHFSLYARKKKQFTRRLSRVWYLKPHLNTVVCYLFQPTKLNVYKNDAESWDYTTPTLGESASPSLFHLPQFFFYFLLSVLCTCNFITYTTSPRVPRHAFQQSTAWKCRIGQASFSNIAKMVFNIT